MSPQAAIELPRIPVGTAFENLINWLRDNLGPLFDAIGLVIDTIVGALGDFLYEPSATQLTVLASAVIALGLLRQQVRLPVLITVVSYIALLVAELAGGVATAAIVQLPAPLFQWAMGLFDSEFVYPPLLVALALLLAVTALSFTTTAARSQWILAGGAVVALLVILLGEHTFGVPFDVFGVLLFATLAFAVAGWRLAVFALLGFMLIVSMNRWEEAMSTLALVLVATGAAVTIAVPIGIIAAYNNRVSALVKPVLDFMQTMPAFVYLIPAIAFFGVGQVPGVIATIVFAMPPGVRLTELGIRQVDKELVEAGEAFGAPNTQILRGIQLPLALATIMAGVNQVIMLSLSMVVIAGMVGAGGLGSTVYSGIAQADSALGFEGGIAVVLLAIFLDRLTSSVTRFSPAERARRRAAAA
ncbi:ABC transporter permease subunit [Lipingzhangella sp. LS1_29]|uniref:ABC transporter permease subunit n=1 Tax=Lipingzhangella rawalii TaxID=2055835 RepID=A0ABU2H992_9ACTN|nr:ABC transporter permease subunit [Lipingzhangella rawalii]MDS1271577.1 ABC transporter permease subunit [Lipingzhangella rawalii]